jgi:hypothetical protein
VRSGEVIGEAWDWYKRHWRHLLPVAFVVYVLITLLSVLLVVLLGLVGGLIAFFVRLAGIFWLQGALVVAIEDVRDGRADLSIGETLSRVRPRLNTLTLAGILAVLGVVVGLLLLVVPGLILLTWWLVVVPAIMLEGRGVFESFGRSRELVRGHGWAVFGVLVLTVLILIAVAVVFGVIGAAFESVWARFVLDVLSQTVTAPFIALAWTMTYYRLRTLKEPTPAPAEAVA